jgi:hypothetical protein
MRLLGVFLVLSVSGCGYLFVMHKQGHTELTSAGEAVEIVAGPESVQGCAFATDVEVVEEYWDGTLCDGAKAVIPVRKKARNTAAAEGANSLLVQSVNSAGCSATLTGKAYRCTAPVSGESRAASR